MNPEFTAANEPHERVLVMAFQGWSDAGNAATSALGYLERGLDLDVFHVIGADDFVDLQMFRPVLVSDDDGSRRLEWPNTRLLGPVMRPAVTGDDEDPPPGGPEERVRNLDGSPTDHVYLLDATEPAHHWHSFSEEILDLVDTWDIDLVVTLGSMFSDAPHSRPITVSVSSDDPTVRTRFDAEQSSYEGPVGVTSVINLALAQAGVATLSLWAQVPHYVHSAPSPKATLALIDRIEELLNIVIPRGDLIAQATEWERNINLLASQDEDMKQYIERLEAARDTFEGPQATGDAIAYELEKFLQIRPDDEGE